jgi:hypothetical protein
LLVYVGLFVGILTSWFGDSWYWFYALVPLFAVYKIVSFARSMMSPGSSVTTEPSAPSASKKKK